LPLPACCWRCAGGRADGGARSAGAKAANRPAQPAAFPEIRTAGAGAARSADRTDACAIGGGRHRFRFDQQPQNQSQKAKAKPAGTDAQAAAAKQPAPVTISPYQKPATVSGNAAYASAPGEPPLPEMGPIRRKPTRRKAHVETDDPYAPLGVLAGGFVLFPAVELIGGYDTNPARSPTGKVHRFMPSRRNCWRSRTGRGTNSKPTCVAAIPATVPTHADAEPA